MNTSISKQLIHSCINIRNRHELNNQSSWMLPKLYLCLYFCRCFSTIPSVPLLDDQFQFRPSIADFALFSLDISPSFLFAFIPLPFILFIRKIHFLGKYSIKIQQFPQDKWVRSVHFVQQSLDSLFRQPFARIFFLFCIFLISISSIINLLGNVTGQWLLLIEIQTLGKRRKRALRRQTGI